MRPCSHQFVGHCAILLMVIAHAHAEPEMIVASIGPGGDGSQLTKALSAVGERTANMQGDLVIELLDGTFYLDHPLDILPLHSGENGHFVVLRAAKDAKPVLSRGQLIGSWVEGWNGIWRAHLWKWAARQFFVDNVRAQRARGKFPVESERFGNPRTIDGVAGFIMPGDSMTRWGNPADIEVGFFNSWSHMTCGVSWVSLEVDGRARVTMRKPTFMLVSRKEGVRAEAPAYIENAFKLLDEPGEWYADFSSDTLCYMPRDGEDMRTASAVITGDDKLVHIRAQGGAEPHHIRFEGITFAEAAGDRIAGGHADVQANFAITAENLYERDGSLVNLHNEYRKPDAAIVIEAAHDIAFDACTFTRIAGAAVNVEAAKGALDTAATDITIRKCEFYDIGGSAIQIGDVGRYAHHPTNDDQIVRNIRVENCKIHTIGAEFEGSVGIFAGYVQNTEIVGNEIYDLPYSGISIGWGWGEEDAGGSTYPIPFIYESPTPARDNRIASNHIHDVMQRRQDGGGVYTLGNMPGTVIEGNHIHDNKGWPGGIYLDEGSGFIEVRNNRVYNVNTPMNFNNRNQNRIDTCNVHDNDFAEPVKP